MQNNNKTFRIFFTENGGRERHIPWTANRLVVRTLTWDVEDPSSSPFSQWFGGEIWTWSPTCPLPFSQFHPGPEKLSQGKFSQNKQVSRKSLGFDESVFFLWKNIFSERFPSSSTLRDAISPLIAVATDSVIYPCLLSSLEIWPIIYYCTADHSPKITLALC